MNGNEIAGRDDWQPIDSAPKDGTKLWLYGWRPHGGPISAECLVGSYEMGYTHGWECERGNEFYATHWMPLPPPPEGASP